MNGHNKAALANPSDAGKADGMKAAETSARPLPDAALWPLSVEAYHRLGEAGLIPDNTELLYGFVYHKMSKSPLHSYLVQVLQDQLARAFPEGCVIRTEQPLTCADSEPEPDLAVVQGSREDYRDAHPHTAELVIEVCVSSHEYDRSKLQAYASAGVRECWCILVPERQIEVHWQPADKGFSRTALHGPGGDLSSNALPAFTLNLDHFFPR